MNLPKRITYQRALKILDDYFGHDKDKVLSFYMSPIEEYGNKSPYQLIKEGQARNLFGQILQQLTSRYA